jgi:hypothetical protein
VTAQIRLANNAASPGFSIFYSGDLQLTLWIFRRPLQDIVLGLALYVGQSQITMRYEASMSSLLKESSKALLHLTEVFQKVPT